MFMSNWQFKSQLDIPLLYQYWLKTSTFYHFQLPGLDANTFPALTTSDAYPHYGRKKRKQANSQASSVLGVLPLLPPDLFLAFLLR